MGVLIVKKVLKFLNPLNIIFFLVLFVFIYTIGTVVANDMDWTKRNFFGYSLNFVMSDSMEPTLMTGDFVVTKDITFDEVEVGDIVVYRHDYEDGNYKSIVHRVIEKNEDHLIFMGDNNEAPDPFKVYPEAVRSVVIYYPKLNKELK